MPRPTRSAAARARTTVPPRRRPAHPAATAIPGRKRRARARAAAAATGAAAVPPPAPAVELIGAGPSPSRLRAAGAGGPVRPGPAGAPPEPEAGFPAHLAAATALGAQAMQKFAAPPAGKPEAAAMAGAAGWERFLPAGWRRFWPVLRRGAAQVARRPRRELRMAEMLTLSEKRFLAVVRYGETQFLIGGAQNSIALLSRIETPSVAGPVAHPVMFR